MTDAAIEIVKVLKVEDTREWVEGADDKWRAIPGTGVVRACDRCGREHEIHWTVELADGSVAIVGGSCAVHDAMDAKAVRSVEAKAKRTRRMGIELAGLDRRIAEWRRIEAEVDALPKPEIVESSVDGRRILRMGDADLTVHPWDKVDAVVRCLGFEWERGRMVERSANPFEINRLVDGANWIRRRLGRPEGK